MLVGGHLNLSSCVVLIISWVLDLQPSSNHAHTASFVQQLSSGLTWQTVRLFLIGGGRMLKTQQITQDCICVQVFCSYAVSTHLSPMQVHLPLNFNKLCCEFSLV